MSINNNECNDDLNDDDVSVDPKETSESRVVKKLLLKKKISRQIINYYKM